MENAEILRKLTRIIRDVVDDDVTPITLETTAQDLEEWDSINNLNIIIAVEVEFNVKFRTAELEKLKNVGEFVALIKQKTAGK